MCRAVVIPECETKKKKKKKSTLKIAAFRVSDWLRSATAWGLWMGPSAGGGEQEDGGRCEGKKGENTEPSKLNALKLNRIKQK